MYVMLSRWILDGELEDPYGEFFIAADLDVKGDLLWHEKYRVLWVFAYWTFFCMFRHKSDTLIVMVQDTFC